MIPRATRQLLILIIVACFTLPVAASELNDSMQRFFDGDYNAARKLLTDLIDQGHVDARIHYFRGLASNRLGDQKSATADFQKGAKLELSGAGHGVGEALQRVQGLERLLLEKHRTIARLSSRYRVQPVAPKPVITAENRVRLTTAESTTFAPAFRLASEIPLRGLASPDPFADDPAEKLVDEPMPQGPTIAPPSEDTPVGTGVTQSAGPNVDEFDPFAEFPDNTPASPAAANAARSSDVIGAVFRAISRSVVPNIDAGALLPPGVLPDAGNPPPHGEVDAPFGENVPFDEDEGDPFEGF